MFISHYVTQKKRGERVEIILLILHFYLLQLSLIFETLSHREMAEKRKHKQTNKMIRIPDFAPIGFESLLRYTYITDSFDFDSVENGSI